MYLQSHIYKNIPVSFDFITTWNQGVFLCSPCILYTFKENIQMKAVQWSCVRCSLDTYVRLRISYSYLDIVAFRKIAKSDY